MKPNALLGDVRPDPVGEILGTGYWQFISPVGCMGLAKWTDDRLDILAISAMNAGTGQFREFIRQAKEQFRTISVWIIGNVTLEAALLRYGFTRTSYTEPDGEHITGMQWQAQPKPV